MGMSEGGERGGFGRGRGRGRGRGDRGRGGRRRGRDEENEWVPVTKLGRLVKEGKIESIEEIFLFSIPVKEAEIIDYLLKDKLHDEVMKIMPVQKQSSAGQRTRFKAFVAIGDGNGHIGLGVKCSSEVGREKTQNIFKIIYPHILLLSFSCSNCYPWCYYHC